MTWELLLRMNADEARRRTGEPESRFRDEWRSLTAAAKYERKLKRERGRLELSPRPEAACCGHHAQARPQS